MRSIRVARTLRSHAASIVHAIVALTCTAYFESRTRLVPRWGAWYMPDWHPYVLLQVRAFLAGRLALFKHPAAAGHDYLWGRGGMHTAWGLGVPIIATPFHVIGRMFGAPGFPDSVRFLVLYAATTFLLARALEAPEERPQSVVAAGAAAGFVMTFPALVGLVAARFLIYDQTIATGALYCVALLACLLCLTRRCTVARTAWLCAAAAFAIVIRPTLAAYGLTTAAVAVVVADKKGLGWRAWPWAVAAYGAVTALYLVSNVLRFGGPFQLGYGNLVSGAFVGRLNRWGLDFAHVPFAMVAKELFATLFLLAPVSSQIMMGKPPPSVASYAFGERWREYYSPTYDLYVFAAWMIAVGIVGWRVVHHKLWQRDRELDRATIVGAWALPPSIVLFLFYARSGNLVTRYAVDLYPAFAAASLSVGMALVEAIRTRRPELVTSVQLFMACAYGLYLDTWRGWVTGLSHAVDGKTLVARLGVLDSHAGYMPVVPDHFRCGDPRGPEPVHTHLEDWHPDCSFSSGMAFAMPHRPCVAFTFRPGGAQWSPDENESLAVFRANADFDQLVSCGAPVVAGDAKRVTMCDPRPPAFLLDGMRFYSIATLDGNLDPIDRLRLVSIDAAKACP